MGNVGKPFPTNYFPIQFYINLKTYNHKNFNGLSGEILNGSICLFHTTCTKMRAIWMGWITRKGDLIWARNGQPMFRRNYFGIGKNKLRNMASYGDPPTWILHNGHKEGRQVCLQVRSERQSEIYLLFSFEQNQSIAKREKTLQIPARHGRCDCQWHWIQDCIDRHPGRYVTALPTNGLHLSETLPCRYRPKDVTTTLGYYAHGSAESAKIAMESLQE